MVAQQQRVDLHKRRTHGRVLATVCKSTGELVLKFKLVVKTFPEPSDQSHFFFFFFFNFSQLVRIDPAMSIGVVNSLTALASLVRAFGGR